MTWGRFLKQRRRSCTIISITPHTLDSQLTSNLRTSPSPTHPTRPRIPPSLKSLQPLLTRSHDLLRRLLVRPPHHMYLRLDLCCLAQLDFRPQDMSLEVRPQRVCTTRLRLQQEPWDLSDGVRVDKDVLDHPPLHHLISQSLNRSQRSPYISLQERGIQSSLSATPCCPYTPHIVREKPLEELGRIGSGECEERTGGEGRVGERSSGVGGGGECTAGAGEGGEAWAEEGHGRCVVGGKERKGSPPLVFSQFFILVCSPHSGHTSTAAHPVVTPQQQHHFAHLRSASHSTPLDPPSLPSHQSVPSSPSCR
jgi:hypothetical protein